jgi:D-xylose 1-dehydrogenase (NADP+, D-xylono-1,5-lactone-forming)
MRQLRWGILGTSRINQSVAPAINDSPRSRLVVVASRSRDRAQAEAQRFSAERAYGSYAELLADREIDAVYIALPNVLHAEWTIAAARAGKHVLCEKPLAPALAEVDAISEAATANGVVVAEAFMYRHHAQTLKVRELVSAGTLGPLALVRGCFSFTMTRPNDVRLDPLPGAGCLWDLGCYPVSYARLILGEEPIEAFGWQTTGATGVDESFTGQLRFPSGARAQFDCSFRAPLRAELEVVGRDAALRIAEPFKPGLSTQLELRREGKPPEAVVVSGQSLYLGEVEDMADCVLEGKAQRMSLADSRGNCAALLALLESARTGRTARVG